MREVSPGVIRSGPILYEYENEIATIIAIVMFPIIIMFLVVFYALIGVFIVVGSILKLFKGLDLGERNGFIR